MSSHHHPPPAQNTYGSYGNQGPPPPQYGHSLQSIPTENKEGRFEYVRAGPKYHDLWATILFLVHFVGFVIVSGLSLSYLAANGLPSSSSNTSSSTNGATTTVKLPENAGRMLVIILAVASLVGAILSGLYTVLMQKMGQGLIKTMFVLSIGMYIALGVLAIVLKSYILGVIYLVLAGLWALCLLWWRSRIPLAALIMSTVTSVAGRYSSVYLFAFLSLVLQFVYSMWWAFTLVGVQARWRDSTGLMNFLIVFLVFSFYWTSQILQNTLHVTVSGTFASFYFLEGTAAMPTNPSLGAAKRAFSTSFGPVAFGSLIVALIQTVRWLLRQAAQEGGIAAAIVDCLMSCIEGLVQYFNKYAYIQVAVYGKSFCEAAKDTWTLIKTSGVDAIINDSLVGTVLGMGSITVGMACAFVAGMWGYVQFNSQMDVMQGYVILVAFAAFFIGAMMMSIVGRVIDSGACTTFVCVAEDPAALARTKPELYQKFQQVYPQIAWRV